MTHGPWQPPSPFTPANRLAGGHRMTLYAWARPRHFPDLPPPTPRYFDVAPGARVLAHCYTQPAGSASPTLLALHGLEGSSRAHYMQGLADKAYASGFNVVLLNQRNCGGTEHLSDGLYHSGLSADPAAVIDELAAVDRTSGVVVVGYSLGGNLALRLAGAHGPRGPSSLLCAVVAVSPTMDLATCVNALERRGNVVYQMNFVRNLKRRMRRKNRVLPGRFDLRPLAAVRTVREFDDAFTAPHHGFRNAADYYERASSLRVIDRIAVPTLIISAADDPFVPPAQFDHAAVRANRSITVLVTPRGGHCAFIGQARSGGDEYWAEETAMAFVRDHVAQDEHAERPAPDVSAPAGAAPARSAPQRSPETAPLHRR